MVLRLLPQARRGSLRRRFRPATLALALASAFGGPSGQAQSLPVGGVAVHGQAAISTPAPNQLRVVTHNGAGTNHSAINWQSFSVSPGSSATFVQPSAASVSINRVVTNTPSALFGNLSSNGRLVLVNPSGIAVGAGAVIDTAGFTASALRMNDADALAGRLRFGDANASMGGASGITVGGRITARQGDVVLVAPNIDIGGSALLQAPNGSTILAAGQQVEITGRGLEGITLVVQAPADQVRNLGRLEGNAAGIFAGTLRHSGEIRATTATLDGGVVVLKASGDAIVEGSGKVLATGGRGGQVDVLGQRVAVTDQALIDVSGTQGGGTIRVGGDYQGKNPDVPNASTTFVGAQATLKADATGQGTGGRVIVWSDDATVVAGAISARGGNQGGSAGFVETSGKRGLSVAQAPSLGAGGLWLLDPTDLELGSGSGSLGYDGFTDVATIISALQAGTPVLATATNRIDLTDQIIAVAAPGAGLTFTAGGNLTVQGSGGLILSGSPMLTTMTAGGQIDLQAFAPVNLGTGTLSMTAATGITQAATSTIAAAGVTVNTPSGSANLVGTGNNLQVLDLTGAANVVNSAALTVASVNSFNKSVSINAGGSTITLPGTPIDLGSGDLSLVGVLSVPANLAAHDISLTGNATMGISGDLAATGNVTLAAAADITLAGAVSAGGNFSTTTSNPGGTVLVTNVVNASGAVTMNVAGTLLVDATGGAPAQLAAGTTQTINALGLSLVAGSVGSSSSASITSNGNQSLTVGAGGMTLTGGGGGGANNSADVSQTGAGGNQMLVVGSGGDIQLTGGAGAGGGNLARINASGTGGQSISVAGSVVLQGGTVGASNTALIVSAEGPQVISTSAITMAGGVDGSDNRARIDQGAVATGLSSTQLITVTGGGSIAMQGGGGTLNSPRIYSYGTSQTASFPAGGSVNLTGGTGVSGNFARLGAINGTQTITGAPDVTLIGGATGGIALDSNFADIRAMVGPQNLTLGTVEIRGGANGVDNFAAIRSTADQTVVASGIALYGGADGGGIGTGNGAFLNSNTGSQNISVGAGGISIQAGGGTLTDNQAQIFQGGTVGTSQQITVNGGGNIVMTGGSSAQTNVGSPHGGRATLQGFGDSQVVTFASGGNLILSGGTVGSRNFALLQAINGSQTISGSSSITLTGGPSGGVAGEGNYAQILADIGPQSITAGGISLVGGLAGTDNRAAILVDGSSGTQTLTVTGAGNLTMLGGGAGTSTGALVLAPIQVLNIGGDLTMSGGGSTDFADGSARIGARSATNTNLNLSVGGNLVLTGGAGNGAFIGAGQASVGPTTDLVITVGGNLVMNPSATQEVRIGSSSSALQTGSVSVTAGGNITLNTGGGAGVAAIRSLGNVTLSATNSSRSITEASGGVIVANLLTATAHDGISLDSQGNQVTTLNATNLASGTVTFTNAPGALLAVSGISPAGGNVVVTADDLNLTGAINAGAGTVTLRPTTLSGNTIIESAPTGGVLSLSPGEIQLVTAATLDIGRLDGTGNVDVNAAISDANVQAGTLRLLAGNNINTGAASVIGAGAGAFNLELRANNNVNLLNSGALMGDNRSQTVVADNDVSGVGDVNIGAVTMQVGSGVGNTTGNMAISGRNIAVTASGNGAGQIQVAGSGTQNFTAINNIALANTNTVSGTLNIATSDTGAQTISAGGTLSLSAGAGTATATRVSSSGNQVVSANGITMTAGASGGGTGTGNEVGIISNAGNQSITVGSGGLYLTAGGGVLSDNAALLFQGSNTGVSQTITVNGGGSIVLQGGSSSLTNVGGAGHGSRALIETRADSQTIHFTGGGAISLTGGTNGSRNRAVIDISSPGPQVISGGPTITLTGGASGGTAAEPNNAAIFSGTGPQTITAAAIVLQGGSGGTLNFAEIGSNGNQTITASGIALTGGAGGGGSNTGNVARIATVGNQDITVGSGGIALTGGGGALTDNYANIYQSGGVGTSQNVTINGGGNLVLQGGSSALTNVGGLGHGSFTALEAYGDSQTLTFTSGGAIQLTGGTNGSRARAVIYADKVQTVSGASTITITGGANGGIDTEGNDAFIGAATQTISAANIVLQGGATGLDNEARLFSVSGDQSITVSGGITLTGGAGGGGLNTGNRASIDTGASQSITVGSGGLHLTGGGGVLTDNSAQVVQNGVLGTTQDIVVNGGGSIVVQGGSSGISGVGLGHGSRAQIGAENGNQTITFTSGGQLQLTGGNGGSRNYASIYSNNGSAQSITGADGITLTGGATGGINGEGNYASISIALGSQTIAVGSDGISISGGSGGPADRDNYGSIFQGGLAGTSQTVTVDGGGNIVLQGGSSTGLNVGVGNGSTAFLTANGDSQLVEFTGAGSSISIVGGSIGSRNNAGISSENGSQTLRGSVAANAPTIALTGGSGGVAGEGNGAVISAINGVQTVSSKNLTLNGGSGTESYALLTAPTQSLVVDGNVTLTGAAATANGGVRIGGKSAGGNTNLTMAVSGNLTVTAGAAAGANIRSSNAVTGSTNDINIVAGGNVTLTPGALSGVQIGSIPGDVQSGSIAISATSIAINPGVGAGNVVGIRSLGNVTLTATGTNIVQAADAVIQANLLTASAVTGINLDGIGNQVTTLNATNTTSGAATFTNAPGALLAVSGINQAGGNVVITADDLNIAGAINAGAGTVTLRPTTLSRNTIIEFSPTVGVLSLSQADIQQVSAATLDIGRLDGTGNVDVNAYLSDANVQVGTLRLLGGGRRESSGFLTHWRHLGCFQPGTAREQ